MVITDPSATVIERELPLSVAAGHRSIKFFMTNEPSFLTDGQVLTVLVATRKNQAFVVIYAENHEAIKVDDSPIGGAWPDGCKIACLGEAAAG